MVPSADIIPPMSGDPRVREDAAAAAPRRRRAHERRPARVLVPDREVGHGARRPALLDVLQAARQDAFDLALEPERGAPDDGLVGRIEPVETGLGDDLLHRAGLRHRLLERPPVGRQHRPDHRAGHRDRRHRLGEADRRRCRRRSRPRRCRVSPENGMLSPAISAMTPPTMASAPRPVQRPTTLLGF